MPDSTEIKRKRLLFHCKHMGMAENDVIFGDFAESHLADLSDRQVDRMEELLRENDMDLFEWVIGKTPPPAPHNHDVMALLQQYWQSVKNN